MNSFEYDFGSIKYNTQNSLTLRSPLFIGDFSLDPERKLCEDKRNLKFIDADLLKNTKVCFDLNISIEKSRKKDQVETKKEKLDNLLNWIILNKQKFFTAESKQKGFNSLSTDFVCFRGLLTELLCTPYENRDGWIIHATKFAGTIYLLAIETPEREQQRLSETEMNKRMSSWGYKFEQFMTSEDTDKGVDENEEYCCVLRSRLSEHSLVYGAEVDGADTKLYKQEHSSLKAFIELKTCKELVCQRDISNFYRFRLRKWWAQSYLVGIPHLICGFRDRGGIVRYLKSFMVEEIPNMAKIHWDKNVTLNFLNEFLLWVKSVVEEDNPKFVYKFYRLPGDSKIKFVPLGEKSGEEFLPQTFVKHIFK